ncbi:MAG: ribonucleotide reductase, partial [Azovibrio sp.]|nr:ribonucleotide reductase [Azovibrio sp.]
MSAYFDDWDDTPVRQAPAPQPPQAPAASLDGPAPRAPLPIGTGTPALAPIRAADKRIVNGQGDINQLAPFKYPWAWEFFLTANKNHWTPTEV